MDYAASAEGRRAGEGSRKAEGSEGGAWRAAVYSRYPFGTDRFCCFVIFHVSQELASSEQNRTCPLKYVRAQSEREERERERETEAESCSELLQIRQDEAEHIASILKRQHQLASGEMALNAETKRCKREEKSDREREREREEGKAQQIDIAQGQGVAADDDDDDDPKS